MRSYWWSVFVLLILTRCLYSQTAAQASYVFIDHLTQTGKNREALFLLTQTNELRQADTLNYLTGLNYYLLKKTDSAAYHFSNVSSQSPFFVRSVCFEALNRSYSKNYKLALNTFEKLSSDSINRYRSLIDLNRAGNYLLLRDFKSFDSISKGFTEEDYRLNTQQTRLVDLGQQARKLKRKSPLVAGCLSAVVPGLGKFYAGKKGAGLAAFAACGALAVATAESYYRSQSFKSPQVITFGTLFVFFYTGNIFGSVYSIKQQIRSTNGRINNEILASIHVPIVRFFR